MSDAHPAPGTDDEQNFDRNPSRRRFLKWLIRLGYGAFALAFALPALAIRTLSLEQKEVAAGDALVYAAGERAGQPVRAEELGTGQATQAFPQDKTENQNNLIQVVRLGEGADGLVAYSAICTHLGCTVLASLTDEGQILCPCHASLFDPANGAAVLRGPAGRPLPSLPLTLGADGGLVADGEFSDDVGPQ